MKPTALDVLVCPACKADLDVHAAVVQGHEILEGTLTCSSCRTEYPIRRGVPRFVPDGLYASSFGRQWNWFRTVQLDSMTGLDSSDRTLRARCDCWEKGISDSLHRSPTHFPTWRS
jgi:uncharacterized protein YbaR (Trm112 family)